MTVSTKRKATLEDGPHGGLFGPLISYIFPIQTLYLGPVETFIYRPFWAFFDLCYALGWRRLTISYRE